MEGPALKLCTLLFINLCKYLNLTVIFNQCNLKYVKIVKYPDRSDNFNRLMPYLKREKILKTEKLNGINIYFISIFKLVNLSISILKKNNNFFR